MSTLLWLDVETTGLDPEKDDLLQVGMAITGANLSIRVQQEWPIHRAVGKPFGDPVAAEMHQKTGLTRLAAEFGKPVGEAQKEIARWLLAYCSGTAHIAGNSVHFDRAFIKAKMPGLLDDLHHRLLDVSSLRLAAEISGFGRYVKPEPAHTALADIQQSIEELKHWQRVFLRVAR